jgi:transposase
MIPMIPGTKVYLACHPVSMRLGFDGLAARVAQVLDGDPFSGHLFLFRAKRAQQATFSIQFSHCQDCLSLASAVRADVAGIAPPSREGSAMYLHGRTARP